jgi:D-alanyl-D-alanine carboxypeptidase
MRFWLLGCFALCLVAAPSAWAVAPVEPPKSFDVEAIDAYIASYVKEKGLVGLSVAIMRDGKTVLAKGYGQRSRADSLPVTAETSFAIGSVTKQFVCACVLLLAEEGKLSVNDPVSQFFPSLTRAGDITLLDLMNHTAGYPDYYPLDFLDRRMLQPITLEGMLKQYARGALDFEPKSRYSYSNTGYIILGGVVEKVTGEKFGDFLQKRILTPLKMEHSKFGGPPSQANAATGYNAFALGSPEPALPEAAGWIEAAGGLWASASDLLRWDLALVSGQVLKPQSYDLMIAPRKLSTGKISSYGCGLLSVIQDGDLVLQHTGGVSGFAAFNAVLPRTKSGLVVLSNTEHISTTPLRTELFDLLLKDITAKESPSVPKIDGPEPKEVVLDFLKQLQAGSVDRSRLGEEFSFYLSDERVQSAAQRLQALGEPEKVEPGEPAERGGMQVVSVKLTFKTAKLRASLYRSPDGKIQQLLFYGE